MKRILVFVLMYLPFTAIYGQKSPCDIKKQDWVTAASNEDGTIQFYLETSSCNGSEMCGNPKVILKHTFNGPTWFKIKLSGYDCAGNLVENDFATGARPIEPNKEFVSVQNWHVFRKLVKILNVEVSVDKVVTKTLAFNDVKNVDVSTATPTSVEDKPAAIENKPVVAAVSTPSVKTEKAVEKPVAAAVSTPSVQTEKKVEKPVVAAASTPSVKTEKKVEKPMGKPAVVQTVEKNQGSKAQQNRADEPKAEPVSAMPDANTQTIKTVRTRLNVLKTNILSPIGLTFERGFGKRLSLGITGLYLPSLWYGKPEGTVGYLSLAKPSMGFLGEARLYTSKKKAPLNGFYVGGYYQFRTLNVLSRKISKTATTETDIEITIPSIFTNFGLMIGGQRIRSRGFTTDLNFGVGYYSFSNIPIISNDSNAYLKNLSSLSKRQSGIAPRLGLSLGYAF